MHRGINGPSKMPVSIAYARASLERSVMGWDAGATRPLDREAEDFVALLIELAVVENHP
jgi:hypothetical protein